MEIENQPPTKSKKHFDVTFTFDDPYPKTETIRAMEARNIGRAVDFAYRKLKKTRPGKREPKNLTIKVIRY